MVTLRSLGIGLLVVVIGISIAIYGFEYQLVVCESGPGSAECPGDESRQLIGTGLLLLGIVVVSIGGYTVFSGE